MKKRNKLFVILISVLIVLFLGIWILWGNTALEVTEYDISSERIPQSFTGFRIAQITDLHNAEFGDGNSVLISLLSQSKPDIIVITGDLIDSRRTDIEIALNFAQQAMKIAPVYYVSGNHEARMPEYEELVFGLMDAGVTVLDNQSIQISREGEYITLMGVADPSFQVDYLFGDSETVIKQTIDNLQKSDAYEILLSHRPELFDIYVEAGVDLVFSGHAHGGQFRLPFVGGLVAPNQGFFPKYDAGQFMQETTTMIVSRGIGNSLFPIRFQNRPELVVVTLKSEI